MFKNTSFQLFNLLLLLSIKVLALYICQTQICVPQEAYKTSCLLHPFSHRVKELANVVNLHSRLRFLSNYLVRVIHVSHQIKSIQFLHLLPSQSFWELILNYSWVEHMLTLTFKFYYRLRNDYLKTLLILLRRTRCLNYFHRELHID